MIRTLTTLAAQSPTRLVVPDTIEPASGFPFARLLLMALGAALLVLAFFAYRAWRERHTDPRELAFRSITKRMALSAERIRELRDTAAKRPHTTPIGILIREYTPAD